MAENKVEVSTKPCPECNAPMPVYRDFRTWCSNCNWNLAPSDAPETKGFLGRKYAELGKKFGQGLFAEMATAPEERMRPKLDVPIILALAVSLCVHLVSSPSQGWACTCFSGTGPMSLS